MKKALIVRFLIVIAIVMSVCAVSATALLSSTEQNVSRNIQRVQNADERRETRLFQSTLNCTDKIGGEIRFFCELLHCQALILPLLPQAMPERMQAASAVCR